jgi:hypothetical protein
MQLAAQHQTAADEVAKVEVQEIARLFGGAEDQFRPAGGGRVVLHPDRHAGHGGDLGLDRAVAPGVQFGLRRAELVGPAPELEGHRDAHARNPPPQGRGQRTGDGGQRAGHEIHHRIRRGPAVDLPLRAAHPAQKIDQRQIRRPPPDLEPQKERAIGRQRHRHRGLADLAAHRLAAQQKAVRLQRAHDDRDGLRRKARHPRDVGFGQRAVLAQQRQHQPFVMRPHSRLIGPARNRPGVGGATIRQHLARWRCDIRLSDRHPPASGPITPLRRITLAKSARSPVATTVCAARIRG